MCIELNNLQAKPIIALAFISLGCKYFPASDTGSSDWLNSIHFSGYKYKILISISTILKFSAQAKHTTSFRSDKQYF